VCVRESGKGKYLIALGRGEGACYREKEISFLLSLPSV